MQPPAPTSISTCTQAVTNGTAYYSTHLITEEDKPDGRVLQNFYDSQRRVTNQCPPPGRI
jgi:hypothetical protein